MIITCTSCQTRFRVADDRIGPKGARVRCSRCQALFVVRREDTLSSDNVLAFASQRLANFKRPRVVTFIDVIPRNLSGKVLKNELRKQSEPT